MQQAPSLLAGGRHGDQLDLEVVEPIANLRRFRGQERILQTAIFLQHPQRFLHPRRIGGHHIRCRAAVELGRMPQACRGVRGGVAGQLVALPVKAPQSLAQVLGAGHQVGSVQPETSPVLQHPQSLPGAIEIGIDQSGDGSGLVGVGWPFGGGRHGAWEGRNTAGEPEDAPMISRARAASAAIWAARASRSGKRIWERSRARGSMVIAAPSRSRSRSSR